MKTKEPTFQEEQMTNTTNFKKSFALLSVLGTLAMASQAVASTVTQNISWTIDRAGTTTKYRTVAYGDSIFAGYNGAIGSVAIRSSPYVEAEYLSALWNTDIESYRRAKSGAVASDIYTNKIVAERSYMQTANTRVVAFEMCGNDGLQARSSFKGQTGTCNYAVLNTALNNCTTYQANAMAYINANANAATKEKIIATLHYPGYNADNVLSGCTDSTTGAKVNMRDTFLPYIAKMNWRACNAANTYGFKCSDAFAEWMGADYDTNADGQVDSQALRYVQGESEAAYVTRIGTTLKATIRDANTHFVNSTTSYDYLQSDDTHPTYTGGTKSVGLFGGTGTGTAAATYPTITGGKNPVWNQKGHELTGWSMSTFGPTAP